jgi:hypothetical protein
LAGRLAKGKGQRAKGKGEGEGERGKGGKRAKPQVFDKPAMSKITVPIAE